MPSNIINSSSIKRSVACYLALISTVAWAQPALDGLGESHFISSDVHSSQGDPRDVFNRLKRPSETQFSRIGTEWMDLGAHSDYQDVAKRQKTVEQYGVGGHSPQPQLDPHASSHSATHDEMCRRMEFEGPQDGGSYELASLPSAPTSPASFLPPQFQHVPLNSDLTFEKEHSMNPTPESMFESMSHHEIGTNDDDRKISLLFEQLQSPQLENADAREWSPLLDNDHVPPYLPYQEMNQAEFERHIPVQLDTHGGQDSIQHPQQLHEPRITNQESRTSWDSGPLDPGSSHPYFHSEFSGQLNENDRVLSKDSVDQDLAQIFSESPRDTNSDESTHEHTSLQSIPLEKVQLPRNIMDVEFLEIFTYKFTEYLHHIFTHSSTGTGKNDYPIAGLPTRISRNSDSYMIWIEYDPNIPAERKRSQNSIQRSQKLSYHLGCLIQWLLFINTAVLRKLNAGKTTLDHSEFDSHQQLIDWLFKESFQPEHCAPILGMISFDHLNAFVKGKEFGPTQRILIKFLSSLQQPDEVARAAVSIIRLYYHNFKPEIWKGLEILDEMDFDWEIESIIVNGIRSQMVVGFGSDFSFKYSKLGNFEICDIQRLPETMKPRSYQVRHDVGLGKLEKNIIQHYRALFENRKIPTNSYEYLRDRPRPGELPALLRVTSYDDLEGRLYGYVWTRFTTGGLPRTDHILTKLHSLVANLKICHSEFIKYVKSLGIQVEENIEQTFFRWIYQLLIKPGNNKLPLFGNFIIKNKKAHGLVLSEDNFSKSQVFLIHYFSDAKANYRTLQIALALIGYWHKNQPNGYFRRIFQKDQEYWDIVIDLLRYKYNYSGFCSLKGFSINKT